VVKTVVGVIGIVGLIATITISSAEAGWGCFARNGSGSIGWSWPKDGRVPNESEARTLALDACAKGAREYHETAKCSVLACSPNVDTEEQAKALRSAK
jgi:hypothetical protein